MDVNRIYCGDAGEVLEQFPDGVVDCVVTSPPYFGQRDYEAKAQIGQEASAQTYVSRLVETFGEVKRVLSPQGTCWIVIGDKYRNKRLLGLPWRLAIAMQDDEWILRSDIIWHKPNAMPSAVKNRPTTDHEYISY